MDAGKCGKPFLCLRDIGEKIFENPFIKSIGIKTSHSEFIVNNAIEKLDILEQDII
jgi:hypothetical protein